jgi:hypothetical protein
MGAQTATAKADAKSERQKGARLEQVLDLLKNVDSVELKLTVPVGSHRSTIKGLGIDPVESEPRQVFFFDTPKLGLNSAGIVVRARRMQGGAADTVIKLRPVVPEDLPRELRKSGACKIELDVLPGGFVCSASFRGNTTGDEVREAVNGEKKLRSIFSKEQEAFFKRHAPKGLTLDNLVPLGPTFTLRSRFYVKRLDRKLGAEMWLYPDGSRILELSMKAEPKEAWHMGAEFKAYLAKHGITSDGKQETKTATALRFFSAELRGKNGKA